MAEKNFLVHYVLPTVVIGVIAGVAIKSQKEESNYVAPRADVPTTVPDEGATRRAGFAEMAASSFANHPGAGFQLKATASGYSNTVLVIDVLSEPCTEQALRQIELIMGSHNVITAGFQRITCGDNMTSIAP